MGFFPCFLSKKLLSFVGAFAISLLLFRGARYLRTKGRGLNVVRRLLTDKLCETIVDFFSFYLKLVTESGGLIKVVNDFKPLTDHLVSSYGSFLLLSCGFSRILLAIKISTLGLRCFMGVILWVFFRGLTRSLLLSLWKKVKGAAA